MVRNEYQNEIDADPVPKDEPGLAWILPRSVDHFVTDGPRDLIVDE